MAGFSSSPTRARRSRLLPAALAMLALALVVCHPALAQAAEGSDTGAFARFASKGPLFAVLGSFLAGVTSSLTPCVYPMVPITVAIFGATESKSRARGAALSLTFVLGIAALFTPLGVAAALSGKLMGAAISSAGVVIGISILFALLASSMFGAFEMALPSSLNNKLSTVGGVGYKGAFILGVAMGLIAAPCTGPFVTGLALYIADTRDVALGSGAMFSFALGLGVIFFVAGSFALSLPKGGAWMLGIKWASGVVLAYMSLAYLRDRFQPIHDAVSKPSLVYGTIAGVLFAIGLAFGSVHIAAERRRSPIAHLSKPMKLASIVPAIVGLFLFVSWFETPKDAEASAGGGATNAGPIAWQDKEADARTAASAAKKPVILDFGATWCTACKELEAQTWPDPRVRAEAQRFVDIKLDMTDDENPEVVRLTEKYKVKGLPTVLILDADGNEKLRYTEFVPPEKLAPAIKSVM